MPVTLRNMDGSKIELDSLDDLGTVDLPDIRIPYSLDSYDQLQPGGPFTHAPTYRESRLRLAQQITEGIDALAVERERCAKIVEPYNPELAQKIRQGT